MVEEVGNGWYGRWVRFDGGVGMGEVCKDCWWRWVKVNVGGG